MDWFERAKDVFRVPRPERFLNCDCLECREHQKRLSATDVDRMTIADLDTDHSAMTMAAPEAQRYYFPAFIRLALETIDTEDLVARLISLLAYHGNENRFLKLCNAEQADFVRCFLEHLIDEYPEQMEGSYLTDMLFTCHETWSRRAEATPVPDARR